MYAVFMILFLIIFMFYEIVYGDSGLPGMAVYGVKYHMHILYLGFIFLILFFRRDFFSGFGGENNKCSKIIIIFFKFITSPVLFLIYSVLVFMQSSISYYSDFIDRGYWVILFFLSVFGTKYVVNFVVLFSKNVGRNRKHFLFKNFFHMIFVFTSCLTVFLYLSKNPYVSENGIVFGIILCVLAINLIISSDDKHFKLYKSMSKVISEVSEDSNSRIAAARRFIERNAYSDISRSDIAAAVGMSPEYLSRMFAASTGKTLSDYVTEIRIKNASELLISTDKTVIEICFDSGFSSLRTFNRTFQKYFLMNPTSFRQKKNAAFGKF
jgi:AraC-like DNA-binding protein